jgi:hypothetical protein
MRSSCVLTAAVLLLLVSTAGAFESAQYRLRDDFGSEPLYDCQLNYYYYTPCPTYSWFWGFYRWDPGDILGAWFQVGDLSMYTAETCDPTTCHTLEQIRVLDFAGYGTIHGCLFCVEFDVYCCDAYGCPVGPSLWNSGTMGTDYAWNYIMVDPPISICGCSVNPGSPPSAPRILVTVTHTGSDCSYPDWGADNISTAALQGCDMHEYSCLASLYPRPYSSYYPTIHSGFYGQNFEYCPPLWWADGRDTTPDATEYGYVELAWRIYLICSGPTNARPSTWGNIKSMYR